MLSKISQTQKNKYCTAHLYEISRLGKSTATESSLEVTRTWDKGVIMSYHVRSTVSVEGDEKTFGNR